MPPIRIIPATGRRRATNDFRRDVPALFGQQVGFRSNMAIEVFYGTAIPRDLATAGLEYVWTKWRTLAGTGGLSVQRLTEESDPALRDHFHYLLPVGDDFAYVYVGRTLVDSIKPGTGGTVLTRNDNDFAKDFAKDFAEVYRRVVRDMAPAFVRFTGPRAGPGTIWQQVAMPVPLTADTTLVVCYSELVNHQLEIYEHLFRTARDAIAIACPITNDAGHVTDGWVLMMNDRAREYLKFDGPIGNLRLRDLEAFNGIAFWGRIYAPRNAVTSGIVSARDLEIEILRFPHVFGLRLRPSSAASPPLAPDATPTGYVAAK